MAIVLGTNSFITEQDFNDYIEARLYAEPQPAIYSNDAKKIKAVLFATSLINGLEFSGYPSSPEQSLQWPRRGVKHRSGHNIPADMIPAAIKEATCHVARFLMQEDIFDLYQYRRLRAVTSKKNDSIEIYRSEAIAKIPDRFITSLIPLLKNRCPFCGGPV